MLYSKKTIETIEDFNHWAECVNRDLVMRQASIVCDYQDVYAHSKRDTLDALFNDDKANKAKILCSVYNTMSYDEVEHLLKARGKFLAKKQMDLEYKELENICAEKLNYINAREEDVDKKEQALQAAMKPYHKKLAELRDQLAHEKFKGETYKTAAHNAIKIGQGLHRDAKRYRQLRALLGLEEEKSK